eukprot:7719812-Pyramimonas_sp.AAC.1
MTPGPCMGQVSSRSGPCTHYVHFGLCRACGMYSPCQTTTTRKLDPQDEDAFYHQGLLRPIST